ncbi:hypothetical protein J2128_002234 [Methanomicrobium sp. W14]|uniref:Vms1/Ankzf1 family peptidyl-tRNA hydrolase n=1 Tax=Methanomicrobium sp. W14 TaxID=2817839 RepID=UPI001AE73E19|nr:Vms1/Ankzf1 family peptidyl-tRNA hydrolase [Methanomicrobium sp. W14]MBP2134268.1 hypothetical protein [Methanomicrobium sp. W14]
MITGFFKKDLLEQIENLKKTVSELEKDNEKLRKRLAKREEKKTSDPAKLQETAEELKRAKAAIKSLEEKISDTMDKDGCEQSRPCVKNWFLDKKKSGDLIDRISSVKSGKKSLLSVYLPPKETDFTEDLPDDEIQSLVSGADKDTGVIGFFDTECPSVCSFFVLPPFPPEKKETLKDEKFLTEPLSDIFLKSRHCVFVLAHAGESCIGLATESGLIKSSLVRSSVKEKHSKGGWSQKRFERLREEDIRHHVEKAAENLSDLLAEYRDIADVIVVSGDKKTGFDILKEAGVSDLPVIYRQFDTKPDRYAGEKLAKDLWSARWYRV